MGRFAAITLWRIGLARRRALPFKGYMTGSKQESPARPARKQTRSERLAAELRANLRRRKAQARARDKAEKPASGEK